jgi:diguanylate cyclase (GGDEF)-like protein
MNLTAYFTGLGLLVVGLVAYSLQRWRSSRLPVRAAMRLFLQPPPTDDDAQALKAALLADLIQKFFLIVLISTLVLALARAGPATGLIVAAGSTVGAIHFGLYLLLRRGHIRLVGWLFALSLFAAYTLVLPVFGGPRNPAAAGYLIIVVLAGLASSGRSAALYALLSALALLAMHFADQAGLWQALAEPGTTIEALLLYSGFLALAAVLLRQAAHHIQGGIQHGARLRSLESAHTLELAAALEAERKRVAQAELLAGLAQRLTGLHEPPELLQLAADHIGRSGQVGYAAAYLVEDGALSLEAAHGAPAGQQSPAIELARRAAQTGATTRSGPSEPPDAAEQAAAVSAVAVPLRLGAAIAGVIYIESGEPGGLADSHVAALESAADLVAAGLQAGRLFTELRRRQRTAETLRRVSAAVNGTLHLPTILDAVCTQSRQAFAADRVDVWLRDARSQRYVLEASFGASADGAAPHTGLSDTALSRDSTLARAAETGPPAVLSGDQLAGQDNPYRSFQSLLVLPLIHDQTCLGALVAAEAGRETRFNAEDAAAGELLAASLAAAIQNARQYAAHQRRAEQLALLNDMTRAALEAGAYGDLLQTLADRLRGLVGAQGCCIVLWDESRQSARLAAGSGSLQALAEPDPAALLDLSGLTARLLNSRSALVIDDLAASPWLRDEPGACFSTAALIGLPLIAGDASLGAALLGFDQPQSFALEDIAFAEQGARQTALAMGRLRALVAERERAEQLELLSGVSRQIADTLDEPVLLQRVVTAMVERLGYSEAGVVVPVNDTELELVAWAGSRTSDTWIGYRQGIHQGILGCAARSRATYYTNDVGSDPYYLDPTGRSVGSAMAVPLKGEGSLLGVVYLETTLPEIFSDTDVLAMETLASHVATALLNARLYANARARLRDLTALQSVSQAVVSSLDLDRVMRGVVQLLQDSFGYRYVAVYQLQGDRLVLRAQGGYTDDLIIPVISIYRGVNGRAVRTRQTQFVRDVSADPDFIRGLPEVGSEICVPLLKDQAVLGTLNVESEPSQPLTEADVHLLNTLAGQVTVAIDNARLYQAEREHRELAEALRDASTSLSATLDFNTILDRLLDQIERLVPYDGANVMLVDDSQARVNVVRQRGYERFGPDVARRIGALSFEIRATPNLAHMLATGRPLVIADTSNYSGWVSVAASPFVRSYAGAPIMAQGVAIAFFSLDKAEAGFYQPVHAEHLRAFAGQAALALQNARLYAIQQRRAEEQHVLWQATQDFTAGLSQQAVMQAIVRHMSRALNTAGCALSLWEPEHDRLVTLYDYSVPDPNAVEPTGTEYNLADYPASRQVLESRQPLPVHVNDPDADPAERALLVAYEMSAALLLPLAAGDRVFGLLELLRSDDDGRFTEAQIQLAQSLAAPAAVALDNARLHAALQDNVAELNALLKANEVLLSTLELDPLLQRVLLAAVAALPAAEKGTILLADPDTGQLSVRAAYGYADGRINSLVFSWRQGHVGQAVRENRPLLVDEAQQRPLFAASEAVPELQAARSAIVAPLDTRDGLGPADGAISLESTRGSAFTPAHLRRLVTFARAATIAINNARRHAEVQHQAVTDSLTGLANPRAFELALVNEVHRAERYGNEVSLIIMDIDGFKYFNDTFGHPAGNERLKAISDILRANVREPDLPARYGGEEFALLLPHTSKAGALALAERVRAAAQATAPAAAEGGQAVPGYTLSLGVASFPEDASSAADLVLAADYAELAAKRTGKNRVVGAVPQTSPS